MQFVERFFLSLVVCLFVIFVCFVFGAGGGGVILWMFFFCFFLSFIVFVLVYVWLVCSLLVYFLFIYLFIYLSKVKKTLKIVR